MHAADGAFHSQTRRILTESRQHARRPDERDAPMKAQPARPPGQRRDAMKSATLDVPVLTVATVEQPDPPTPEARGMRARQSKRDRLTGCSGEHDPAAIDRKPGVARPQTGNAI